MTTTPSRSQLTDLIDVVRSPVALRTDWASTVRLVTEQVRAHLSGRDDDADNAPGAVVVDSGGLTRPPDQHDDREEIVQLNMQGVAAVELESNR
jgi:hypothetical protein